MEKTIWSRPGFEPTRMGLGCLPVQRLDLEQGVRLIRMAYDAGVRFFDTARAYSDSEQKVGLALADVRNDVLLATKTTAKNAQSFWADLKTSLETLKTDVIDLYQFHNPPFVPVPGGEDGLYDAMLEAKAQGKIKAIGITQHSGTLAMQAIESGLYDTLQYPFNHLASEQDIKLVKACKEAGMGFIAMKALSGGLITDASRPFAFLRQYEQVVPIWGVQRVSELEQLLAMENDPPALDDAMKAKIDQDRQALSGAFCRGCGYCQPCPVGIPIENANRMTQLLQRSPTAGWLTPEMHERMLKIKDCIECKACESRCPYHLKPYETLKEHLAFYEKLYFEKHPKGQA